MDELPRQRFSRMHVGVIGVLLVLGVITTGWLLLRARPVAVASPSEVVTMSTPLQSAPTAVGFDQRARHQAGGPCAWRCPAARPGQAA